MAFGWFYGRFFSETWQKVQAKTTSLWNRDLFGIDVGAALWELAKIRKFFWRQLFGNAIGRPRTCLTPCPTCVSLVSHPCLMRLMGIAKCSKKPRIFRQKCNWAIPISRMRHGWDTSGTRGETCSGATYGVSKKWPPKKKSNFGQFP